MFPALAWELSGRVRYGAGQLRQLRHLGPPAVVEQLGGVRVGEGAAADQRVATTSMGSS